MIESELIGKGVEGGRGHGRGEETWRRRMVAVMRTDDQGECSRSCSASS